VALNLPAGGVKVWELTPTFREVFHCPAQTREPILSPDGRRLATRDEGREATVWDVATGKRRVLKGAISGLVFSPDGRRVATRAASGDRGRGFEPFRANFLVRVVDVETGEVVMALKELATGSMAFSPDGAHLATSTPTTGEAVVWEVATGKARHRLKGHGATVSGIAFSPDGRRIATVSQAVNPRLGTVKLWDARTGSELLELRNSGLTDRYHVLSFSPDGHRLSLVGDNGVTGWAQMWDATPRQP
jgi:WD40 repeat protein